MKQLSVALPPLLVGLPQNMTSCPPSRGLGLLTLGQFGVIASDYCYLSLQYTLCEVLSDTTMVEDQLFVFLCQSNFDHGTTGSIILDIVA